MATPTLSFRRPSGYDSAGLLSTVDQTITATGNSATPLHVGAGTECEITVAVKSVSGTNPTIDVSIRGDDTLAFGSPVVVDTLPQLTDTGDATKTIAFRAEHDYIDASWVVTGTTPSFDTTISVRA